MYNTNRMRKNFLKFALLGILSFASIGTTAFAINTSSYKEAQCYANHDADTYYSGISDSLEGDDLLNALRALNADKRKKTVGYKSMGTSPSGQFRYTDYDPSTVQYDSNGQPYGTKLITFYSGKSATGGMNREHVWPNSHGGDKVEADIHMPRPTLTAENGSRGNDFYVEGGTGGGERGWDPAAEDFGVESYRGDSARIIFYCVVADSRLSLYEGDYHQTSRKNNDNLMGRLSHMLKWNLKYPVLQREQNRNEGAEYLQGNRNPFIDHPEYACRIWGNANAEAQAVCSTYMKKRISVRLNGTDVSETKATVGDDLIFSAFVDNSVVSNVTWSLENENGTSYMNDKVTITVNDGKATIKGYGNETVYLNVEYTYVDKGENVTVNTRVKITYKEVATLSSISVQGAKTTYYQHDKFTRPTVIATYSDGETKDVSSYASFEGFDSSTLGTKTITVTYQDKTTTYQIEVRENIGPLAELKYIEAVDAKLSYEVGDEFVKPTVIAHYSDNTQEDVTNLSTFEGFDSSTVGSKKVIVTYSNKTTEINIYVKEKSTPTPTNKGCGGNIVTTSVVLSSLAALGLAALLISRLLKKKDR